MNFSPKTSKRTVSVIVPVFNDQAHLLCCLDAFRHQTYSLSKIEVIIVDNGSTPPIFLNRDYPFDLRIVICDKPGSYSARNLGVTFSSGELIAFTDADCVPDKEWIKAGVEAMDIAIDDNVVGGEVEYTEPTIRSGTALYQYLTGFYQKENIESKGFSATANLFCTKEQFFRIGFFDERLLSGGDREWAWRASNVGIHVQFEGKAIVRTPPRSSLQSAIRQARRVAAGRAHLKSHGLTHRGETALVPHRSLWESMIWFVHLKYLSPSERFRVTIAAVIIRAATSFEKFRIMMGCRPERR